MPPPSIAYNEQVRVYAGAPLVGTFPLRGTARRSPVGLWGWAGRIVTDADAAQFNAMVGQMLRLEFPDGAEGHALCTSGRPLTGGVTEFRLIGDGMPPRAKA